MHKKSRTPKRSKKHTLSTHPSGGSKENKRATRRHLNKKVGKERFCKANRDAAKSRFTGPIDDSVKKIAFKAIPFVS